MTKEIVNKFEGQKVLVIGDFMLDHYTWGEVDRISPEAPVVVVRVSQESIRAGGAGNVVANLTELGAKVFACGVVGEDENRDLLFERLTQRGANIDGLVEQPGRVTTSKNRIIARSQQVVRVDREAKAELEASTLEKLKAYILENGPKVDTIIVSDYGKGVWNETTYQAAFSKQTPVIVDPKPRNSKLYQGSTLITPNRTEAELLSGLSIETKEDATQAGKTISENLGVENVLITLGSKGMLLVESSGKSTSIETEAKAVFDVSGAGDTVVSVMGLCSGLGVLPSDAAKLANRAAGVVVAEVGTVPISKDGLMEVL